MTGFPGLGLLRPLRPIPSASTGNGSSRAPRWVRRSPGPTRWFPRSLFTVRQVRCPTMPLRSRHEYAAGLPRGLQTGDINRSRSSPHQHDGGAHRCPAQIRQVRAGGLPLRGVHTLVHCRYTFLPRSPDPHHLTVLARPGIVRAACHPPPRPWDQAALSFSTPAATGARRCPFTTARFKSASWRSMS